MKNRSITYQWFLSYLLILLIPVFGTIFLFNGTSKELREETSRNAVAMLQQAQNSVDQKLSQVQMLMYQVGREPELHVLSCVPPGPRETRIILKQIDLRSELEQYLIYYGQVRELFVYFPSNDWVVSATTSVEARRYHSIHIDTMGISYSDWVRSMLQGDVEHPVILQGGTMSLLMMSHRVTTLQGDCYVIATLDTASIRMAMEKAIPTVKGETYVFLPDRMVLSTGRSINSLGNPESYCDGEAHEVQMKDRQTGIVFGVPSECTNFTYLASIPNEVYSDRLNTMTRLTTYCLFVIILLGALLSFYLVRWHYKPIRNIVSIFSGEKPYEPKNELAYIENSAKVLKNKVARQQLAVQENFLQKLCKGKFANYALMHNSAQMCGLDIPGGALAVLLTDAAPQKLDKLNQGLAKVSALWHLRCEVDGYTAYLLIDRGGSVDYDALAEELHHSLSGEEQTTIAVSSTHQLLDMVPTAYAEALDAIGYRILLGSEKPLLYNEITRDHMEGYAYPIDEEQRLIDAILQGREEDAIQHVKHVFDVNMDERELSPIMARALLSHMNATIMRTANRLYTMYHTEVNLPEEASGLLGRSTTLQEGERIMLSSVKLLCLFAMDCQDHTEEDLVAEVMAYMQAHLDNQNLSVESVCHHFHKSRSYMFALLKRCTGNSLLYHLQEIRMERARELLINTRCSVQEISSMCGFTNVNTFIRIFKKALGTTPNQYRQNQWWNDENAQ